MESNQFEILKDELKMMQSQMDKYDGFATSIKTWTLTLWGVSVGWAFQSGIKEMLAISLVLLMAFWLFEGINKTYRMNYKKRRDEVAVVLQHVFKTGELPDGISAPQFPNHDFQHAMRNALLLHISVPYLALGAVSVVLYFLI